MTTNLIQKGHSAIHYMLNPEIDMTTSAAKGLNAVAFELQSEIRRSGYTIKDFHKKVGAGPLTLRIPISRFKTLLNLNTGNYEFLHSVVEDMGKIQARWNRHDGNGNRDSGFYNLFIRGQLSNRMVEFDVPYETRLLLASEHTVAVIDFIKVAQKLKSRYAIHFNDLIEEQMFDSGQSDMKIILTDEVLRNGLKIPFTLNEHRERVYKYKYPSEIQSKILIRMIKEFNEADLNYFIDDYCFIKTALGIEWHFTVTSKEVKVRKEVAEEFSEEIFTISVALKQYGVSEHYRAQVLTSLSSEYEICYVQYCIEQTQASVKKGVVDKPAGYLMTCLTKNRNEFDVIWQARREERNILIKREAEQKKRLIDIQKEEHRKRYIQWKVDEFVDKLRDGRLSFSVVKDALLDHLAGISVMKAAKEMATKIKNEEPIDYDSHLFRSFATNEIEISQEELDDYINSQAIIIETD